MHAVKVRNLIIKEGMPALCVPLCAATPDALRNEAGKAAVSADMLEWRMDHYEEASADALGKGALVIRETIGELPLLATFRTAEEGGCRSISSSDYHALYAALIERKACDLIDLELTQEEPVIRALIAMAHDAGIKVVISSHDFAKTPSLEAMTGRLRRMQQLGADIAKLAVMPQDELDVLRLLEASVRAHRCLDVPLITMAMGALGTISRLGGETFHSAVTFASMGKGSAPGQLEAVPARAALQLLYEARER